MLSNSYKYKNWGEKKHRFNDLFEEGWMDFKNEISSQGIKFTLKWAVLKRRWMAVLIYRALKNVCALKSDRWVILRERMN